MVNKIMRFSPVIDGLGKPAMMQYHAGPYVLYREYKDLKDELEAIKQKALIDQVNNHPAFQKEGSPYD